ncbi:hypothetical protein [Nonomuraea rubra]
MPSTTSAGLFLRALDHYRATESSRRRSCWSGQVRFARCCATG